MDIVALEFLCYVSAAREQLDRGTDLELVLEAADALRALEPDHHLLPQLAIKILRLREAATPDAPSCQVREMQKILLQLCEI